MYYFKLDVVPVLEKRGRLILAHAELRSGEIVSEEGAGDGEWSVAVVDLMKKGAQSTERVVVRIGHADEAARQLFGQENSSRVVTWKVYAVKKELVEPHLTEESAARK
ncbi:hypothetical protein FWD07_02450 [Candidatus Saccharibacteria bacterium]|nr:hypothetical protein [Candidatus Saccharibacteria bacterium]